MKIINTIKQLKLSYHAITIIIAIYFSVILNLPIYKSLHEIFNQLDAVKTGFIISIPFFFTFALTIIFSLFSWPKITKIFFSILLLTSSLVSYATYNYGTIFNAEMIENLIETNVGEASSYLSLRSVLWFLGLGVLPTILLILTPIKQERFLALLTKKLGIILISGLGIGLIASAYYQDYVSVGRNNGYIKRMIIPTYYVNGIAEYIHQTYFYTPLPYVHIGLDAKQQTAAPGQKPSLVVFILGETARTYNYHSNGYPRPTTPFTDAQGVISYQHVASCGTATAVSVPCMFSRLDRKNYNEQRAYHQDNLIDVLNRAGIDIFWKENDAASKGIPKHVKYQELKRNSHHPLCTLDGCKDMALLNHFEQDIHALQGNSLVVLHLIGSHGPAYFQRYPQEFAYFQPDCQRDDIENCTHEQLINTYDNTIRYTDYVVAQTIDRLKQFSDRYNTALIYLSDHGESLGENGIYLHGLPYSIAPMEQKHVPLMVWLSDGYQAAQHIDESCLKKQAATVHVSQDNLFDSLLGALNVSTHLYRPAKDIFSACRKR
ncbi:phosphoethanolamine transferase [Vibrio gazogenes]|uniref:Lipid A ethanolaminephosphotransferase n=1 Tax=Vibrio gazogenes DSM 21264 = NBRC 103151 TaxID=1123492 RepID=A0A1M4UTU0_VIBGA|nr:phosphoethanolamine--lipid A transferase [Vibrio gazogenes]USP15679.1 phosphoethanolamine--lipid A transferase [Vibrio gazogenes]SHE60098.1 lipid A ethanolaminephosphotransferase [Vibrio gazogenes DSM 21264] [Vibrio gazogenes DSM 21264 = NBRC 103151]SJN56147.1 Phosphoethanolamine transferase EptA [Vibrio gazogenes]